MPESWNPITGQSNSGDHVLLLLSNIKSGSFYSHWSNLLQRISQEKSISSPVNQLEIDCSQNSESNNLLPTNISSSQCGIMCLNFSKSKINPQTSNLAMQDQISHIISELSNSNKKCLIIAHSWTGVVINNLIELSQLSDNDVTGVLTINSPLDGAVRDDFDERKTREALQLLSLMFNEVSHPTVNKERNPKGVMDLQELQSILTDLRGEYDE